MKKTILWVLTVVLLLSISITLPLAGCKGEEAAEAPAEEEVAEEAPAEEEVVAEEEETYIFPGAAWSEPFWTEAAWGALRAGEQIGAEVKITGPMDMNADELLSAIDQAVAEKPTGIITYPWEMGEADSLTEYYNDGGLIGLWFEKTDSFPVDIWMGPDATIIAKKLLEKAIEIRGNDNFKLAIGILVGAGYHELIQQTIADEIEQNHPNITLVQQVIDQGKSGVEEADANAAAFVSANPDVDVYIVTAALLGSSVARALQQAGNAPGDKTLLYGYFTEACLPDLESGYLNAAYALNSNLDAYWLVRMLHSLHIGEAVVTEDVDAKYNLNPLPLELISRCYWIDSLEMAQEFRKPQYNF